MESLTGPVPPYCDHLDWSDRQSGPPLSALHSNVLAVSHVKTVFLWLLGIQTPVIRPAQQAFLPTEPFPQPKKFSTAEWLI